MPIVIAIIHHYSGNANKCFNNKKEYIMVFIRIQETKLLWFTDDVTV